MVLADHDHHEIERVIEAAIRHSEMGGHERGRATAEMARGWLRYRQHDLDAAWSDLASALRRFHETGHLPDTTVALGRLAHVAWALELPGVAVQLLEGETQIRHDHSLSPCAGRTSHAALVGESAYQEARAELQGGHSPAEIDRLLSLVDETTSHLRRP
jgi:hypothetical protein